MSSLVLSLLGPPRLERDGAVMKATRRKATALLAYLAVTGQRHGREVLADFLYPELDRERSRADFRNLLYSLRAAAGDEWIGAEGDAIWLQQGEGLRVDVVGFRDAAEAGLRAWKKREVPSAQRLLSRAASLYRGEFLSGFGLKDSPGFDDWQMQEAENLRHTCASVLERLTAVHEERGELAEAIGSARRCVSLDPLSEPMHRMLMRLHALGGDRAAALRQFERCRSVLRDELGEEPEEETIALRDRIASRRLAGRGEAAEAREAQPTARPEAKRARLQPKGVSVLGIESRESDFAMIAEAFGGRVMQHAGTRTYVCIDDGRSAVEASLELAEKGPPSVAVALDAFAVGGAASAEEAAERVDVLLGSAQPGQILFSGRAAAAIGGCLPADCSLRSLGLHRLKDLGPPQPVCQLLHPGLPGRHPALRTLESSANNLPTVPTALVGRLTELAEIVGLLGRAEVRLLTLTGPGGTGKTRLALRSAAEVVDRFRQGVYFVDLAPLRDSAAVLPAIIAALGVQQPPGDRRTAERILQDYIGAREMLLVLDNFEHLLSAVTSVASILGSCARLKVLATSRQPLRLQGEQEYPVPPLRLGEGAGPAPSILASESVRLFVQRASGLRPDFSVDAADAPAVAEICARLDGLPLAIELAASRTKLLSPRALLDRLDHRLDLLSVGPRDLPERQRALRSEIDWSYGLLGEPERRLFRRLAVFPGGCTVEAAESVCRLDDERAGPAMLDLLATLADSSLLTSRHMGGGPRFSMLETICEYAAEQLQLAGEWDAMYARLAAWVLDLAERAEPMLYGPHQDEWLSRLDAEYANISVALAWHRDRGPRLDGLRLAGALGWHWFRRARFVEGRRWLEWFRGHALEQDPPAARAKVACCLGWMAAVAYPAEPASELELYRECLRLSREADDARGIARSMAWVGFLEAQHWEPIPQGKGYRLVHTDNGYDLAQEAIAIARKLEDPWTLSLCLTLAYQLPRGGESRASAEPRLDEAVSIARRTGDRFLLCHALDGKGLLLAAEDPSAAEQILQEAQRIAQEIDDKVLILASAEGIGESYWRRGMLDEGAALHRQMIPLAAEIGAVRSLATLIGGLQWIAAVQGRSIRSAKLWGIAMAFGYPGESGTEGFAEALGLDEQVCRAAWEAGNSMSAAEAVEYALSHEDESAIPETDPQEARKRWLAFLAETRGAP